MGKVIGTGARVPMNGPDAVREHVVETVALKLAEATALFMLYGIRPDWILAGYERHVEELRAKVAGRG